MGRSTYTDVENQRTDINLLVTEMLCMLELSISKRCQISIDLAAEKPYVTLHAEKVMQVLLNLITNAVEAIGSETGVVHVSTCVTSCSKAFLQTLFVGEALDAGDYAVVSVSDSGVGIPAENRVKIFEPYFTTKAKGHGIGLSTVQHIVAKYGGAIGVMSDEALGTTISIYFPLAAPRA